MTFLQDNGFDLEALNAETLLTAMRAEMQRCLAGPGDLPMIPAGFCLTSSRPVNRDIPAFDVGGTNVRSARVHFDAKGNPEVRGLTLGKMPGAENAVDETTFYAQLCDILQPNLQSNESLGYCFSYPVTPEGKLLVWTKNIQAPEIVGTNVVDGLVKALAQRGMKGCSARILNDTVAALLAAYACEETYAGYVGFILGTGMNAAYAEATDRILKAPNLPKGALMPINCESGNFRTFPRSRFDERYDAYNGTGQSLWERCISGVHLGALGTEILHAAAEAGHFSEPFSATLRSERYTTVELDRFCSGQTPERFNCTVDEAEEIRALLRPMYQRAALFTAVNIAAAALQSVDARAQSSGKIRINVDGSTFWKAAFIPFKETVSQHLDALLTKRGYTYDIVRIDDAPLIGAAIAVG